MHHPVMYLQEWFIPVFYDSSIPLWAAQAALFFVEERLRPR
jgi:hypothetical protein